MFLQSSDSLAVRGINVGVFMMALVVSQSLSMRLPPSNHLDDPIITATVFRSGLLPGFSLVRFSESHVSFFKIVDDIPTPVVSCSTYFRLDSCWPHHVGAPHVTAYFAFENIHGYLLIPLATWRFFILSSRSQIVENYLASPTITGMVSLASRLT